MLKTPTAGSPRVSDDGEVLWRQVGDLRYFASIELLLGWLGTRSAIVDGNSVIVPARVLDEDWVGPVRLDLTTNVCYPVRRCLFEFVAADSTLYWESGVRRLGYRTNRLGYRIRRFSTPEGLGGFIGRGLHATDPRWKLE